jgi:hypothetical protein
MLQFTHVGARARARKNERKDMAKVIADFVLFFVANAPKMTFQSLSGMGAMQKRWDVFCYFMRSLAVCRNQDEQATL